MIIKLVFQLQDEEKILKLKNYYEATAKYNLFQSN